MDVEDLSIFWCLFQFLFYVLFKVFTLEVFHFLVWFTSIFSFQSYWEWIFSPRFPFQYVSCWNAEKLLAPGTWSCCFAESVSSKGFLLESLGSFRFTMTLSENRENLNSFLLVSYFYFALLFWLKYLALYWIKMGRRDTHDWLFLKSLIDQLID